MKCKCGCGVITPIAKRNRYELGHVKGQHIDYLLGHKMRGVTGKNHFNFKGNNAGYKAFHLRVGAARGKADICEDCNSTQFVEWANLTGNYQDVNDYKKLCRKCHHAFDDIANKTARKKKAIYGNSYIYKGWETRKGVDVTA